MMLGLPAPDHTVESRLTAARHAHNHAVTQLARHEQYAAARIARHVFGSAAARLVLDRDVDMDGDTSMTLLVVLDADGKPIWFHEEQAAEYPGYEEVADDHGRPTRVVDSGVCYTIENHLEAAYDAAGGVTLALDACHDEHLSVDGRYVIELDIAEALTDPTPEEERAYDGSNHPQRGQLDARTRDILVRLIRDTGSNVFTPDDSGSVLAKLAGDESRVRIDRLELPLLARAAELLDPRD